VASLEEGEKMPAAKNSLQKVLDLAGKFVTKQHGEWNHDEWEALLPKVAKMGFEMGDETKRNLGNILEASKHFYHNGPPAAVKKKA